MIDIYGDGSCDGNPGPGGWAAIIVDGGKRREIKGREENTTNNRMEILAAIKGLEQTPPGSQVTIHSDSQYLVRTMTENWKRSANLDLWHELDSLVAERNVDWKWIKGHAKHFENERANRLANEMAGIMAAKQTSHLIPLCHPLPITNVSVEFKLDEERSVVDITATVKTTAQTGVEMEALTAVAVAALTIYDMSKAMDRGMRIESIRLARKSGGKSGEIVLED